MVYQCGAEQAKPMCNQSQAGQTMARKPFRDDPEALREVAYALALSGPRRSYAPLCNRHKQFMFRQEPGLKPQHVMLRNATAARRADCSHFCTAVVPSRLLAIHCSPIIDVRGDLQQLTCIAICQCWDLICGCLALNVGSSSARVCFADTAALERPSIVEPLEARAAQLLTQVVLHHQDAAAVRGPSVSTLRMRS